MWLVPLTVVRAMALRNASKSAKVTGMRQTPIFIESESLDEETHRARSSRKRRERIAANGTRERYSLLEIGDRDGWICGVCGDPVDPVAYRPADPRSASIDHIRPIALGGADTRANVRITHLFCNMNRRDYDGFTGDELADHRKRFVAYLRARGLDDLADREQARRLRRVSDPATAQRALAARVARGFETKPSSLTAKLSHNLAARHDQVTPDTKQ